MKNKKLFLIIALVVVTVIALPVLALTAIRIHCQNLANEPIRKNQTIIHDIDKIALLGENPAQKADAKGYGGCGFVAAYMQVSKDYSTNMNGGQAVDSIRTNLTNAGYKITDEYFGVDWGCHLVYRARAQKDNVKLGVSASQDKIKDPTCSNENSFARTTEAHFRSQNIDSVYLRLSN